MKKTSAAVTRGSLQLVSNAAPASGGAVPPVSVAPWQPAHERRYNDSPSVACASVYIAARAGAGAGPCAPRSTTAPIVSAVRIMRRCRAGDEELVNLMARSILESGTRGREHPPPHRGKSSGKSGRGLLAHTCKKA